MKVFSTLVAVLLLHLTIPGLQASASFIDAGGSGLLEEKKGVVQKTTVFWIGFPEDANAMAFLKIPPGTEVEILGVEKEFFKIEHRSLIGFVEQEDVKLTAPATPEALTEEVQEPQTVNVTNRKAADNLYLVTKRTSLRTEPDSRAHVILRLPVDGQLKVLESSGKWWWKVRYKGKTGWAKAALLKRR